MPEVAPSRGRGLKQPRDTPTPSRRACRPFTGAWIETLTSEASVLTAAGRPFTGAWIETFSLPDLTRQ